MPTVRRRSFAIMASALCGAAGLTRVQGFCFVPALTGSNARCHGATPERRATQQAQQGGGLTMRRGLSYKGKNGPGLTNIGRVVTTRKRVLESEEPCKVMISNLDYSLTENDVAEFCGTAGAVAGVKLVKKWYAKTSKGYGFVDFDQPLTATIAIETLNGKELKGRVVELKPAITSREKRRKQALRDWEQRCLEEDRRVEQGYPRREVPLPEKKKMADFGVTVDEFLEIVGRTNSRTAKKQPKYAEEIGYDDDDDDDDDADLF
ncbi:unnamed protein product [Ectocarpus sp. 6 AP-2014]